MIMLMVFVLEDLVLLIKSKRNVKVSFFFCIKLTKNYHDVNIMIGDNDEK